MHRGQHWDDFKVAMTRVDALKAFPERFVKIDFLMIFIDFGDLTGSVRDLRNFRGTVRKIHIRSCKVESLNFIKLKKYQNPFRNKKVITV